MPKRQSLKRASTDFDKELDELLEKPGSSFNPTQVFMVDPDMELAMLRADQEYIPSTMPAAEPKKSLTRTLSRWDTAPPYDCANHRPTAVLGGDIKRHVSEPPEAKDSSQASNAVIDDLDGIDINVLAAAIDDAENSFASANQGGQVSTQDCTQKSLSQATDALGMFSARCKVVQVPIYSSDGSLGMQVSEESTGRTRYVTIEGVWKDSFVENPWQVQPGDTVHLLSSHAKQWESDHVVIGDSDTLFPDLIVFHPDNVLSSTTLSASATCHRRSVVQNRVLAPQIGPPSDDPDDITRSLAPIIGNCVHEAVQAAAAVNNFKEDFVLAAGHKALDDMMLADIWECGATPSVVLNQLTNRLSAISHWGLNTWPRLAKSLRGCEVEIRPKSLGVTGKLDMDIEDVNGARSCIEIKTGKHHAIHVGQVVLYYLLQYVDKYGNPDKEKASQLPSDISQEYILLYLQASQAAESIKVKITAREAQNIMRNRNLIASHNVRGTLPSPIFKQGDCQFCPTRQECAAHFLDESHEDKDVKKFLQATLFAKKESSIKTELLEYQRRWLDWINRQQYSDHVGGLSAVRRMRGNLLHMVSSCLLRDTGVHEGTSVAYFNYMKILLGKSTLASQPENLTWWLTGYRPRHRVGRAALVIYHSDSKISEYISDELISPLISANERVLLCGTSHGIIDSVLVRLIEVVGSSTLNRITRLASKSQDLVQSVRERLMLPDDWMTRIDEIEKSRILFACTVKAVHHDILSRGDFSVAIVLGADKVPDAALWGVMIRARQVVLVGSTDPPNFGDMDDYLFNRLSRDKTVPIVQVGREDEGTQAPITHVVELE